MMNIDQARAGDGSNKQVKLLMAEPEEVDIPEGWKKSSPEDEDPTHQQG